MKANVLVIGKGGRENAMVFSLAKSDKVEKIFIITGNGGTEGILGKSFNVSHINENEHQKILEFINQNNISLTVVGPEGPLSEGIVDFLQENKKPVFGPEKAAAKLESSKIFMKDVLVKAGVPTAKYKAFKGNEKEEAFSFLETFKGSSIVIKADGLAAGKGVVICQNIEEAKKEVSEFLEGKFGDSSKQIVIEEFLDGFEASLFGVTDGTEVLAFGSACDHKRIFDNDLGGNTGGMGTFSPSFLTPIQEKKLTETLIKPVVLELAKRGIKYKGVLFAGLMVCDEEVKVLEFNARFGDPETQSILSRFEGDFYELCFRTANETLKGFEAKFRKLNAVSVVLASKGYPETSSKGDAISLPAVSENTFIFHAGTLLKDNILQTDGGRVLAVTSLAKSKKEAREKAYKAISGISFEGMQFRKDIGEELVSFQMLFNEMKWKEVGIGFYDFFSRLLKITLKTHFSYINDSSKLNKIYEFSILLTNDAEMQELNKQHRGKDKPTNVLSFPLGEEYEKGKIVMGDIVIALETMQKEALEQEKSFKEHLAHLFVHSVLHLFEYDHEIPSELEEMEELEDKILNQVF